MEQSKIIDTLEMYHTATSIATSVTVTIAIVTNTVKLPYYFATDHFAANI